MFNSVDLNIKFTLEIPSGGRLNFLDLTVWVEGNGILYERYKKEIDSGNSLKQNSWLPNHVKTNFIRQSFASVHARCAPSLSEDMKDRQIKECKVALTTNGFSHIEVNKALSKTNNFKLNNKKNFPVLKLPFVSDSLTRQINACIKKHNLNVRLVNTGNKKLRHVFKPRTVSKHVDCNVCNKLPEAFNC